MREDLKSELDLLFRKKNTIGLERRLDPRLKDFEASLRLFLAFSSIRDRVIRPVMEQFGRYLESLGHRYFIETAEELVDGHKYPTSRITLHFLLNANLVAVRQTYPSFSFRMDENKLIYAIKKTHQSTMPVVRYNFEGLTSDLVEQNLKQFLIETIL